MNSSTILSGVTEILAFLLALGTWFGQNPVQGIIFVIAVAVFAFVLRFILGFTKAILILLIILLVAGVTWAFLKPWFMNFTSNDTSLEQTDWYENIFTASERRRTDILKG